MSVININFEVADQIIGNVKNSYSTISSISSSAKGISADAFSSYSPSTVSGNESFQDGVAKVVTDVENFISSFDSSVQLYREEYEKIKKDVEEKVKSDTKASEKKATTPTTKESSVTTFTVSDIKHSELKATSEFYFNYKGNVKEVHEMTASEMGKLLLQNGAVKEGNVYYLTIDGKKYGYNPSNNQISINGKALKMYSKFYVRNDADISSITNTITLLSGQDVVDQNDGPAKAAARSDETSVFKGVQTEKNGLVIVPYGREYGGNGWPMAPGVSAATRIGNFMIGAKSGKKVNNSIVGFSLGGYAAYATVSQNKGLYNSLVVVNSRMRTEGNGATILGGGSWDAFEGVEIILFETRNDDNPTGAIKFLHKNVKNLNLSVYTNNSNFIKTMKEVGRSKDCHVINDNSSKWSAHKYGIAILKDSGIFGYLTS